MRLYSTISVTGTHGKTTTTSLLVAHLHRSGRGADRDHRRHHQLVGLECAARPGQVDDRRGGRERRHVHAAADRDRHRHQHRSRASRLLRLGRERCTANTRLSSATFRSSASPSPASIIRSCATWCERLESARRRPPPADLRREQGCRSRAAVACASRATRRTSMRAHARASRAGRGKLEGWSVPMPGAHNALNALAAIAVATRSRARGREDQSGDGRIFRRQTALPVDRRLERRRDLRRLRPSPGGDRGRARGGARAAPRVASSPSSSRIAIRACAISSTSSAPASRTPTRHRRAALYGRRKSDRGHRSPLRSPKASERRDTVRRKLSIDAGAISYRRSSGKRGRAISSSVSARATRRSGRMRCPSGWQRDAETHQGASRDRSRTSPSRLARDHARSCAGRLDRECAARRYHMVSRRRTGAGAVHAGR